MAEVGSVLHASGRVQFIWGILQLPVSISGENTVYVYISKQSECRRRPIPFFKDAKPAGIDLCYSVPSCAESPPASLWRRMDDPRAPDQLRLHINKRVVTCLPPRRQFAAAALGIYKKIPLISGVNQGCSSLGVHICLM